MKFKRIAAIDLGSNTILMMIGERDENGKVRILRDVHEIARLGEGINSTKLINPEAVSRAKNILQKYGELCRDYSVEHIEIDATSAMREALNRKEVCRELESVINAKINIIPGEKEAGLSFYGVSDESISGIVLDIGGGSTEIISGEDKSIHSAISLPIGVVKITEKYFPSHPPTLQEIESAAIEINEALKLAEIDASGKNFYGVAGTVTNVAAVALKTSDLDIRQVHKYNMSIETIEKVFELFLRKSIKSIIEDYGLNPKRADVITAGTLILLEAMKCFNKKECIVSVYGLRYGILKDAFDRLG